MISGDSGECQIYKNKIYIDGVPSKICLVGAFKWGFDIPGPIVLLLSYKPGWFVFRAIDPCITLQKLYRCLPSKSYLFIFIGKWTKFEEIYKEVI